MTISRQALDSEHGTITYPDYSRIDTPLYSRPPGFPAPGEMAFWLRDSQLGTLPLTCDNGYVVAEYNLGYPTIREVSYDVTLENGRFDLTRFHGARVVDLSIVLRPTATSDGTGPVRIPEPRLRDRLLTFLHPQRRPELIFQEHEDFRVRRIRLRASKADFAVVRPRFNKMSVAWVAPLGIIESAEDNCYDWTFDAAAEPVTVPVLNLGNTDAHWSATIKGAIYHPTFELLPAFGGSRKLQLEYTASPGDVIEMDSFLRRVTVNGEGVGYRYASSDASSWWTIPPGAHQLRFTHNGIVDAGSSPGMWVDSANLPVDGPTVTHWEPNSNAPEWVWATGLESGSTGVPLNGRITFCVADAWI
jgi:hypothetical protein